MFELADLSIDELKRKLQDNSSTDTVECGRAKLEAELGRRHARHGDYDQALRYLAAARAGFKAQADARSVGAMDAALGAACAFRGDQERAKKYLDRALATAEELDDADLRARTINLVAEQALKNGDHEGAHRLWLQAQSYFQEHWDGRHLSRCLTGLALTTAKTGNLPEASQLAERAEQEADASADSLFVGRARLARAAIFSQGGDFKRAKRYYRRAITIFQAERLNRDLAEAYLSYGLFYGALGQEDGAGVHDPAAFWLAKAQALFREVGGLADLERVRDAFRRYGRRATDRVSEVEVLQLLQELKRNRLLVQHSTHQLSEIIVDALSRAERGLDPTESLEVRASLKEVEAIVSTSLEEIAVAEERFLAAVNAVVVERENVRSLIELTRSLSDAPSYTQLVQRVAEQAAQLTTAERTVVALVDHEGKLDPGGCFGIEATNENSWRAHMEQIALRDGRAELLYRDTNDSHLSGTTARRPPGDSSDARAHKQRRLRLGWAMVVPLRQGEHVFGAIYTDKEVSSGVFTERDLDLLAVYAGQAAAILENRRIREELTLVARARAATLDAVTDGVVSIDSDGAITSINATASRILGIRTDVDRLPRVGRVSELEFLRASLRKGEEFAGRITTVAGSEYLCNTRLIRDADSRAVGAVATFTELKRASSLAHRMVGSTARYSFSDLIGKSPALKRRLVLAEAASRSDSSVLITGESGTGKEVLAQAIHNGGTRAAGPFVAINCAAIPRELLESELFGYDSGAFTGARTGGRPGKFELAEGGTILLDEVGDMPLEMQAKLLRVLQERVCQRLAGTRDIPLNCRVIATTNRDLGTEVGRGLFRQDLYFRLRVLHINLPPLRERPDDVARLTEHFLRVFSERMGKKLVAVEPAVMEVLLRYPWPGNIRELEHILEGEVNLAAFDQTSLSETPLMLEDAMKQATIPGSPPPAQPFPGGPAQPFPGSPVPGFAAAPGQPPPQAHYPWATAAPMGAAAIRTVAESERDLLEAALSAHRGKIPAVARSLGVSRGTIYNKMKKFKIDPAAYRA